MNLDTTKHWPAPFWFLNHKLEKSELKRQLLLMKEQHIKTFFMHPRAGLLTPYSSEEWFDTIKFIIDEAQKLGMEACLYDEDPFPSGPAGGRILMNHPEFAARELKFHRFKVDKNNAIEANLGCGKLLEAKVVTLDENDNILTEYDCFNQVGVIREEFLRADWQNSYFAQISDKKRYFHYRAETFSPHLQINLSNLSENQELLVVTLDIVYTDSKYGQLTDNLNPKCVKEFIRLTHSKYQETLQNKLGNPVKYIFTDETPCCNGGLPYNQYLEKLFIKKCGYSPIGNLCRIFVGNDEKNVKIRLDYYHVLCELFINAFYKPINRWCRENKLKLTGHCIGEENPLTIANGGNLLEIQKFVGIPGFDHITFNIPDGKNFTSLNLGGKLVSSAASQNSVKMVQSESLGCNPYNFNMDGMFKVAHWLYALGVNWLVPHGFHYSYDGFRKDDAGKSFFFQDENYCNFHKFADYFGNLGYALGQAKSSATVCLLHPVSSFQQYLPTYLDKAELLREEYYQNIQKLVSAQIQFEFANEESLLNAKFSADGKFKIGHKIYNKLVLPFANLTHQTIQCIEKLKKKGVTVFTIAELDKLKADNNFIYQSKLDINLFMTLEKDFKTCKRLYLFNNQNQCGIIRVKPLQSYKFAYLYQPQLNQYYRLECNLDGSYSVAISNYGAFLLEFSPKDISSAQIYHLPEEIAINDFTYEKNPNFNYCPHQVKVLAMLKDFEVEFNGKNLGIHRFAPIRNFAGTNLRYLLKNKVRPIFDQAPLIDIYPASMRYQCKFDLPDSCDVSLLFEESTVVGNSEIFINGNRLNRDNFVNKTVYDVKNLICDLKGLVKKSNNVILIEWAQAKEFDGLNSMFYIISKEAIPKILFNLPLF